MTAADSNTWCLEFALADRLPAFRAVIDILNGTDAAYGNLATIIFDPRTFSGAIFYPDELRQLFYELPKSSILTS